MQLGINNARKNLLHRMPNTLVTLTLPYLLVTFRLKPFFSGISLGEGPKGSFPEVT